MENWIIVVGGLSGNTNDARNYLSSSEALLLDQPCALPDLPKGLIGPAVVMREGPDGKEVVSDQNLKTI